MFNTFQKEFANNPQGNRWLPIVGALLLNGLPLLGILIWGWKPFEVVFFYWLESVMIGVYTLLKIGAGAFFINKMASSGVFLMAFFVVHYGAFNFAHGRLVFDLSGKNILNNTDNAVLNLYQTSAQFIQAEHLYWVALQIVLLYLGLFIRDLVTKRIDNPNKEMTKPYSRVMLMQFALIATAAVSEYMGKAALILMIFLIVGKTFLDVKQLLIPPKTTAPD